MVVELPILMYHSVSDDPPAATRGLSVRPADLAQQLRSLREHGFVGLTFGDLWRRVRGGAPLPERPIVITFDDGYADTHEQALPLLDEYGFPATVFVTTGWLADAGRHAAGQPLDRTMNWRQVNELVAAGIEVAAHSHSHPQLDQLPDAALRDELSTSRALLEDNTARPVTSIAYPFGYASARVHRAVEASGYLQAAAVANTSARPGHGDFAVPRLTVRRSTSLPAFDRVAACQGLGRLYALDRALTMGYSIVRKVRYAFATTRRG